MEVIVESLTLAFDDAGAKIISFLLIIVAAYYIPLLLLSLIRVPVGLSKLVSFFIALFGFYFAFMGIFIT